MPVANTGRVACRAAVTTFFTDALAINGGSIPYVGTVYSARPLIVEEAAYEETMQGLVVASSPTGGSAVMVVNLPADTRRRKALTGFGAVSDDQKFPVALEVWYANVGGEGLTAQDDYDAIIDQVVFAIRSDPSLNDPTVILIAGDWPGEVTHDQSLPKTDAEGLTVFINGVVRFDVTINQEGPVVPQT